MSAPETASSALDQSAMTLRPVAAAAASCCTSTLAPAAGGCGCASGPAAKAKPGRSKTVRLSELQVGETARVVRLTLADAGCRRRFAELGLAEGMKVSVTGAGETLIVALGSGRMALAQRCAQDIWVMRVA